MAANSRATSDDGEAAALRRFHADNVQRVFCTKNGTGISFYGDASDSSYIGMMVESFCDTCEYRNVDQVLKEFRAFIKGLQTAYPVIFYVGGFNYTHIGVEQKVFLCYEQYDFCTQVNYFPGMIWDGDMNVVNGIYGDVYDKSLDLNFIIPGPAPMQYYADVPLETFRRSDAVDYVTTAMDAVEDLLRLKDIKSKTRGHADILLLYPGKSKWISQGE